MFTVLIVCTGNICRSSMADGMLKKILNDEGIDDVQVLSAGTDVTYIDPTPEAVQAAMEYGADISKHKAIQINKEMINKSDLILTMSESHKKRVIQMVPEAQGKVYTLKEYVGEYEDINISDPFMYPLEVYRSCGKEIYENLNKAKDKFKNKG